MGGDASDQCKGVAVGNGGGIGGVRVYITGYTASTNFPTTFGALDTSHNGGSYDAFVAALNTSLSSLAYSTFYGGSNTDWAYGIDVNALGQANIMGDTASTDLPVTLGAYDTVRNGEFDAFVAKVNHDGNALLYGTYLGGSDYDDGGAIAVDAAGHAFVSGHTASVGFPVTVGAYDTSYSGGVRDAFAARLEMRPARNDQENDGRTDLVIFRPSVNAWFIAQSSGSYGTSFSTAWGASGDVPLSGDIDGDGEMDLIVFRPSVGVWFALLSSADYSTLKAFVKGWGAPGDTPLTGDMDGDGRSDLVIYRPSVNVWFVLLSSANYTTSTGIAWGASGDVPISGDIDGDGKMDLIVYRPAYGVWFALQSSWGWASIYPWVKGWGAVGDTPLSGDVDGDGRMDLIVFRPSVNAWFVLKSEAGYTTSLGIAWGAAGDIPLSGDVDGDGKMDLMVYRPDFGVWFALESSEGYDDTSYFVQGWGSTGDQPVP